MTRSDENSASGGQDLSGMTARTTAKMYQVTFSDQSMGELNKMSLEDQMKIVEAISHITPEMLEHPREPIGCFSREGRTFYRFRADDLRCYFEIKDGILYSHYIIRKHTLTDFIFRFKLPVTEEQIIEQNSSFWKYLDTLTK
jgi:hypothetical protein